MKEAVARVGQTERVGYIQEWLEQNTLKHQHMPANPRYQRMEGSQGGCTWSWASEIAYTPEKGLHYKIGFNDKSKQPHIKGARRALHMSEMVTAGHWDQRIWNAITEKGQGGCT